MSMMADHHENDNMRHQRTLKRSARSALHLFGVCVPMPESGFLTYAAGGQVSEA